MSSTYEFIHEGPNLKILKLRDQIKNNK